MKDLSHLFGIGSPNIISDELFQNKNIKYISIFHITKSAFTNAPSTEGTITFMSDGLEGKRCITGSSIYDVLKQMIEFCKTIK